MKRLWVSLFIGVMMISTVASNAADTKVNGRLYADWHLNTTDGADSENAFDISRAYVTVKSKLSEYTSVRLTTDIRSTSSFDGYTIILKYGYIDWKPQFAQKKLNVRFGLHATPYIDYMNKYWGRRYLEKTVGDLNKFMTSSDLGVGLMLGLGEKSKYGVVEAHVFNGTSYSDTEEMNKQKNFNFFGLFKPFTDNEDLKNSVIFGQAYIGKQNEVIDDTMNTDAYKHNLMSIGGLLAYSNIFDVGADLNFLTEGGGYEADTMNVEVKSSGISVFGTLYFEGLVESDSFLRTLNLFGRIDMLDPDTDMDDDGENLTIIGVECSPVKGFKASVNYRVTSFENDALDNESYLFVNTLFKF